MEENINSTIHDVELIHKKNAVLILGGTWMKQFFGYRVLDGQEVKVEYYILNNKDRYGIQIAKRDSNSLSSSILNISDNKKEAIYFISKCFQNITLPENLPIEVEKMLASKEIYSQ